MASNSKITESLSPGTDLLLLDFQEKNHTNSHDTHHVDMEMELTMLWRTLKMLRYSINIPGVLESFYKDLLLIVNQSGPLSLSTTLSTDNITSNSNSSSNTYTDISKRISTAEESTPSQVSTLNTEEASSFSNTNQNTNIVQKLYNLSENYALVLHPSQRSTIYLVCLSIAVKSGQLSRLLQSICLLLSANVETNFQYTNLLIFNDIINYIKISNQNRKNNQIEQEKLKFLQYSRTKYRSTYILKLLRAPCIQFQKPLSYYNNYNSNRGKYGNYVQNRVTLSFGKADHGKLGFGDTQVLFEL